jgi:type IV pilus assembly protein PilO
MAFLEKINEINARQRLLVLAIILGLLVAGFWYLVWAPTAKTMAGIETQLAALQTDLQGLRAIHAKLPEFKAESERLQKQLVELRKKLPQDKELPELLNGISRAATESGLQYELFKPKGEVKREFYNEVSVDIKVRGPFHNIVMFIDKIVHLPRIVNIPEFNFSGAKDEGGYLFINGTGLATTYRYQEKT